MPEDDSVSAQWARINLSTTGSTSTTSNTYTYTYGGTSVRYADPILHYDSPRPPERYSPIWRRAESFHSRKRR